jgi:hypothetical protein
VKYARFLLASACIGLASCGGGTSESDDQSQQQEGGDGSLYAPSGEDEGDSGGGIWRMLTGGGDEEEQGPDGQQTPTPSPSTTGRPTPTPGVSPTPGATPTPRPTTPVATPTRVTQTAAPRDQQALPTLPAPPTFSDVSYPDCRNDYRNAGDNNSQIRAIDNCTNRLNSFYSGYMNGFVGRMNDYQNEIGAIYRNQVAGRSDIYTPSSQQSFYQQVQTRYSETQQGGRYYSAYRETESRYRSDIEFLRQQRSRVGR